MNESKIKELLTTFEAILQYTGSSKGANVEFWLARDLQRLFEYAKWENFETVVKKAAEACQNAGGTVDDHFLIVEKEVKTGHPKRSAKLNSKGNNHSRRNPSIQLYTSSPP